MRKTLLVDCNPQWGVDAEPESTAEKWISFDCPEGHEHCRYIIPFTPALDGTPLIDPNAGGRWQRSGEAFEHLTLAPSIKGVPSYESIEEAIAAGVNPQIAAVAHPRVYCHAHFFVSDGAIIFCGDSR